MAPSVSSEQYSTGSAYMDASIISDHRVAPWSEKWTQVKTVGKTTGPISSTLFLFGLAILFGVCFVIHETKCIH